MSRFSTSTARGRCGFTLLEVIIAAAVERTESRGSHYRSDFPQRDDTKWLTNLLVTWSSGKPVLRREWVAAASGWTDRPGDIRIKPWG